MRQLIKKIIIIAYYKLRPIIRWGMVGLPIKPRKAVFDNFMGEGYEDTLKCIADGLIEKDDSWDIVWLVKDFSYTMPYKNIRCVKYDSFKALYEMATAKLWVDNVRNTYKPLKRKKQIYLQTWHGNFPAKKIEAQENKLSKEYVKLAKEDGKLCDGIITGNQYCYNIMDKFFWLNSKTERLKICSPRTDALFDREFILKSKNKLREKFKIIGDVYVVLYAPTYREDNDLSGYIKNFEDIEQTIGRTLGCSVKILLRRHPNACDFPKSSRVIDVTHHPNINELFALSDMVITDYSSVGYEFVSILKKPVILYMTDLDRYLEKRNLSNLFDDMRLPMATTMLELINILSHKETYTVSRDIRDIILFNPGHGTEDCIRWIYSKM